MPAATAAPDFPSEAEVDDARQREQQSQDAVADAESELAAASADLDRLTVEAMVAVEDSNEAEAALQTAEDAEATAQAEAQKAAARASEARAELGGLAANAYANGGDLRHLAVIFDADDAGQLYDGFSVLKSVTGSQAGIHQTAVDTRTTADARHAKAEQAAAARADAADEARRAAESAQAT